MKRYISIFFSVLFVLSVNAQMMQEVISSAGGYNVNRGVSISWTLGETIIPTFKSQDGTLILTHGVQQEMIITAVEETIDDPVKIKVFPNPADAIVNMQFEAPVDEEIIFDILDSQGKLVKTDLIDSAMTEKQINVQDFPAGIYYLRLTKGKHVNVYKIVKL
ncbi:MAG: T9SS type A sorting domain-containing protein [Bacteroidales bacterium]